MEIAVNLPKSEELVQEVIEWIRETICHSTAQRTNHKHWDAIATLTLPERIEFFRVLCRATDFLPPTISLLLKNPAGCSMEVERFSTACIQKLTDSDEPPSIYLVSRTLGYGAGHGELYKVTLSSATLGVTEPLEFDVCWSSWRDAESLNNSWEFENGFLFEKRLLNERDQ